MPPILRRHGWRLAFILSGTALLIGGPMHPKSDARDPLREELATMTGDDRWVLAHAFVLVAAVLLTLGLWAAHRAGSWPVATRRALLAAAVAWSAYSVETVIHLAAVLDHDNLAQGESAPIAFLHVGLGALLTPVSGLALVMLALAVFRSVSRGRRPVAAVGVLAGAVHSVSVPATLVLPDVETSPLFAAAGVLIAAWALLTGLTGVGSSVEESAREPVTARR